MFHRLIRPLIDRTQLGRDALTGSVYWPDYSSHERWTGGACIKPGHVTGCLINITVRCGTTPYQTLKKDAVGKPELKVIKKAALRLPQSPQTLWLSGYGCSHPFRFSGYRIWYRKLPEHLSPPQPHLPHPIFSGLAGLPSPHRQR